MGHLVWLPLLFIFFIFPCELALLSTKHHLCPHDQMHALMEFKNMFYISDTRIIFYDCHSASLKTLSWNNSDCCLWDGVTCDRDTGDVIELDLSCSNLNGSMNPNTSIGIFRLTHLRRLNLAYSFVFHTDISPAFGRFTHLTHLNLSSSWFTGSVPPDISFLSKLVSLDLSHNDDLSLEANAFDLLSKNLTHLKELILTEVNISSSIPNSLMNLSSLEVLDLSNTGLQGSLPGQIFMLPNLRELKLGPNHLRGDFPEINVINTSSLEILELSGNALLGQRGLPDSIGSLESLTYLDLSHCNFSGAIPKSLGNLTEIIYLGLSFNNIQSQIPITFSNLQKLLVLSLGNNMITGTLPLWLFTLPSLVDLDLRFNQLTGPIHDIKYESSLEYVDLSNNQLQGLIPSSIANLVHMTTLDLSNNHLVGPIPFLIANLVNMTGLDLSSNRLTGPIHDIKYQSSLEYVDLSNNQLQGLIPSSIANLVNMTTLDLSNNHLVGPIPSSIENLVNLTFLVLSSNNLSGNVEQLLFSKLERLYFLDLSRNSFQGSLPLLPTSIDLFDASHNKFSGNIPSSICNLTVLNYLVVSYNDLGGPIPQCLLNNLQVLDLQKNRFSGTIPPISAYGHKLTTLNLNGNHLEGHVPESLANCKKLELIDLGRNKLNGSFPLWLESFPKLQVLVLHSNKFQGPIGKSRTKSPYSKLRIFDLSDNEFSGCLPVRYFQDFRAMKNSNEAEGEPTYMGANMYIGGTYQYQDSIEIIWKGQEVEFDHILTTLATIDLSANRFEGEIPEVLGKLISLRLLNLSHNSLTGPIPASLGNLANLETLDLSSNILTGTIPMDLASIPRLPTFDVSNNHLVGPIPRGKQFDTFGNNSYFGNLGLCGPPLSNLCHKKPPNVTQQKEDHSIFSGGFTWKIVMFGYGCGVPFGLILGFLMLFFGWPRWFQKIGETKNRRKVKRPKGIAGTPGRRRNLR